MLTTADAKQTLLSPSMPRRVAYVHDANVFGGMEVLQMSMLRHLDTSRYEPFVVVPGYDDELRSSPKEFISLLHETGINVLRPPHPGDTRVLSLLHDVQNIAAMLRQARIDVVHIQTRHPEAAARATLATALARIKGVVRTEHLPPSHHMTWKTRYKIIPFDWMTDYIVADSDADRAEHLQLLGRSARKVVRSYCGIDAFKFNPDHDKRAAKRSLGLDPNLPVVGAVGRLHEQKGHTYLLDAIARVIADYGPLQFVLVGDGPLMAELRAKAEHLGITAYTHFAGFQSDYVRYMEAMDIGVMPSLWEGFSISMQEFMALGKPLVVTDHASFREALVHGEHGLIAPVRNGEALATHITKLLREPEMALRLGRAATARVRQEFSIQRHMSDLMTLYDSLLGVHQTTVSV